jgi:hypothetical protein
MPRGLHAENGGMRILIPSLIVFLWGAAVTLGNLFGSSETPTGSGAYEAGRSAGQLFAVFLLVAGAVGIVRWYRTRSS